MSPIRTNINMLNEASEDLASADAGDGEDEQGIASSLKALQLSNPPAWSSKPCISPLTKTRELGEHASDSGYGSASSTPDPKQTTIPRREPIQIPLIRQMGLFVSRKSMDPETKRRFLEVQLEIEKMLLEFMRKLKTTSGRYKPIAIRPMMLGKTNADADAKSFMVVICSENIKRKVQDFFDEPLVKSLCEPGDDEVPSFKALVIGHALRLRASTSDIRVQCGPMDKLYDGTKTFCGTPISLCDEFGHSRNATFGGMVKVTFIDGEFQLYGLTAGHLIKDHRIVTNECHTSLDLYENDLVDDLLDMGLSDENMEATQDLNRTVSPMSNDIDKDSDNWCFRQDHRLGKVLDTYRGEGLANEEQNQPAPCLDWALFETNALRPNQLSFSDPEVGWGDDLRLPSSTSHSSEEEIYVSMLCASKGVNCGRLSTTRARVLLDPGDSFTDAYTLSLDGSNVSDGDSGSWVVDVLRLEVYGHVVADDVFGDAYVIPMSDILADIRRCFGARSVDLPTGLDIISMRTRRQPHLIPWPTPRDRPHGEFAAERTENMSHLSNTGEEPFLVAEDSCAPGRSIASAYFFNQPRSISLPVSIPPRPASVPPPTAAEHLKRKNRIKRNIARLPRACRRAYSTALSRFKGPVIPSPRRLNLPPHTQPPLEPTLVRDVKGPVSPNDSGYSSLNVTPNPSPLALATHKMQSNLYDR